MPGPALIVSIVGDASKLSKELNAADGKVQAFGKSIDIGGVAKVAALAGGVTLAADALFEMGKAAGEDRAEAAKLDQVIRAAGAATGDYTAQVEAAITAGQDRAFSDTQTRDALQSLVTATGSVTASTSLLATAQDVARFAGVDLATAADAVAKAQAGQDMQLARLIPGLQKGATATDTIANAQAIAAGQADAFAASTEGQMARSSDAFGELGETIGSAVLPILDALLPALVPIIRSLGRLVEAVLPILVPLLTALGKALAFVAGWVAKVARRGGGPGGPVHGGDRGRAPVRKDSIPDLGSIFTSRSAWRRSVPTGAGVTTAGLAGVPRSAGGGGGVTVNVYGGDPTRVEAAVARALQGYTRRNGKLGLAGMAGR
jgi:hypothetical protein